VSAPVRFGVLGCSAIAWRRTLPALRACPLTTVTAVASRDPAKARRFAAEYDCGANTYEELLLRDDVDAVYLPLPPSLHRQWGSAVLRAGKHLFTEKPLAACSKDAYELAGIAKDNGLLLRENFMFLHHPQHARVADALAAGELGVPRSFRAAFAIPELPATDIRYRPELGGGSLRDVGVYPIRAAQLFLGDDLRVAGAALRVDAERGVDVGGKALLVSGDGVLADVEFGFQHGYASYYEFWGSEGRLRLDRAFTPPPELEPVLSVERQGHTEERTVSAAAQFELSVGSFAEAVLAGRTVADAEEAARCAAAIRTVELVEEIGARATTVSGGAGWERTWK
jgi:NDP-hexose-3-ketoreductase